MLQTDLPDFVWAKSRRAGVILTMAVRQSLNKPWISFYANKSSSFKSTDSKRFSKPKPTTSGTICSYAADTTGSSGCVSLSLSVLTKVSTATGAEYKVFHKDDGRRH